MGDKLKRESARFVDGKKASLQVIMKPRPDGQAVVLVRHHKVGDKPAIGMVELLPDEAAAKAAFAKRVQLALDAGWVAVDKVRGVPKSCFSTVPAAAEFPRAVPSKK